MDEAASETTTSSPPPSLSEAVRVFVRIGDRTVETQDPAEAHRLMAARDVHGWLDCTDPSPEQVQGIAAKLELHPLIAEEIIEHNQRAKIAEVDRHLHIVLFALGFEGEITASEVDFVLGERFLLTVHDADFDPFRLPQLREGVDKVLQRGSDYLLYAIADGIVDDYFPALDSLTEEIDQLEDDVVEKANTWTLQRLFTLKRELMSLRRATSPAREIFNQLTNRQQRLIAPENLIYFRDVYDHLIRVTDEVDNDRELVSGTLDVYLSTVNNNLSLIMKRLTGVTVILAGVGALAGVFGMSEASAALSGTEAMGFWMMTLGIAILGVITAAVLRRIDWL